MKITKYLTDIIEFYAASHKVEKKDVKIYVFAMQPPGGASTIKAKIIVNNNEIDELDNTKIQNAINLSTFEKMFINTLKIDFMQYLKQIIEYYSEQEHCSLSIIDVVVFYSVNQNTTKVSVFKNKIRIDNINENQIKKIIKI